MAHENVVAVFETTALADKAVRTLKAGGFSETEMNVIDAPWLGADHQRDARYFCLGAPGNALSAAEAWKSLVGGELQGLEAIVYARLLHRGGALLVVRTHGSEVAQAISILGLLRPVDVHARTATPIIAPVARSAAEEPPFEIVGAGADGWALPMSASEQEGMGGGLMAPPALPRDGCPGPQTMGLPHSRSGRAQAGIKKRRKNR